MAVTPENIVGSGRSLQCLINAYRDRNGRGPLTRDADLELASFRHSADMLARDYFDHDAASGSGSVPSTGRFHDDRAVAAGYPAHDGNVFTSETLAAVGPVGTPYSLFLEWRASASHNAEMLRSELTTMGVGIIRGFPGDHTAGVDSTLAEGATATAVYGNRNRGGTDTAADLTDGDPTGTPGPHTDAGGGSGTGGGTEECETEEAAAIKAAEVFRNAKAAKDRAAQRKRRAVSRSARQRAVRKLRAKKVAFKQAKSARNSAELRYGDCLNGL